MVAKRLVPRTLVAMPKDATPPPAQPLYEGYRWLGSQWGRSGKPTGSRVNGGLMSAVTVFMFSVAINAARDGSSVATVIGGAAVGTGCLIAAAFYFIEAHFAGRAMREQEPTMPATLPEPPAPTEPSVGP